MRADSKGQGREKTLGDLIALPLSGQISLFHSLRRLRCLAFAAIVAAPQGQ